MNEATKFVLGVNYWPRMSAMAMWSQFDRTEIAADFKHIARLGLSVVRFFLLWEAFQPAPDRIDETMLERLEWLLDALAAERLQAMPTFFTGHMSGVNWLPEWTLDRQSGAGRFRTISAGREQPYGIGDFYRAELLAAQVFQAQVVGTRLRGHPAILAWDLGNEFSNMREPRLPADGAAWSAALSAELMRVSQLPVTGGTHGEDLTRDRQIRLSSICKPWIYATMHGYSVYSDFARSRLDVEVVPFLADLARACSGKPVLFSEFGNPTCPPGTYSPHDTVPLPSDSTAGSAAAAVPLPESADDKKAAYACLSETEMTIYARGVLNRLHARGGLGAFWWCWADYAPALAQTPPFDQAPHELSFGIIRNDGSEKLIAGELAAFAAQQRTVLPPPAPMITEDDYFAQLPHGVAEVYRRYVAQHEDRPT